MARKSFSKTTIISYGDTLAKINFNDLLKKHIKSKAMLTLVVSPLKNPFGIVEWNNSKKVTAFKEKPIFNHFIGYAVIEPKIFKFLPKNIIDLRDGDGLVKAIKKLSSKRLVNAYTFDGLNMTVNSSNELREAKIKIGKYYTFDEILQK